MVKAMLKEKQIVKGKYEKQISEMCTSVDARVLPSPMIKYNETGKESQVAPVGGKWTMNDKKFNLEPVIPNTYTGKQLDEVLSEINRNAENNLELLLVILPDHDPETYGKIKTICETELGIVSQCFKPVKIMTLERSKKKLYLENVGLKINLKAGGRNSVLLDAISKRIPILTDKGEPTIIFGADVTHPSSREGSTPSIAAVVASMDWPEVTYYKGVVSTQGPGEEIITGLYTQYVEDNKIKPFGMIRELLKSYYRLNNQQKPKRIIFYRDGVCETQFANVLLHEMKAIKLACATLELGYQPKVTFVVVLKRHKTRLFPVHHNLPGESLNVMPGTVVDTKICHPCQFDFYLCSHPGEKGTSRPMHYHVLQDENHFTADELQNLANSLCYTHARGGTTSVSLVPPVSYADLAAHRARYYMKETPKSESGLSSAPQIAMLPKIHEKVMDTMFYC
ncbi:protein argonaute PNH1-like isoform X2 [Silene latifolia]|uniref:protein argonaute PNH1-like isoform X2 n=1 Tax=Silene latifolia TaxID=37657 RepID=UPI003D786740